jgi:enamine deaminase RidA (YjgF/YER057c/UK114 family)
MKRDAILESLGYPLDIVPQPAALYRPIRIAGGIAYASGALPAAGPQGALVTGIMKKGDDLAPAQAAARLCAANILRALRAEIGSLELVKSAIRVGGFIASAPDFTNQHLVLNGASELLVQVLGEAGVHARAAVGVASLPLGALVEVEATFLVDLS